MAPNGQWQAPGGMPPMPPAVSYWTTPKSNTKHLTVYDRQFGKNTRQPKDENTGTTTLRDKALGRSLMIFSHPKKRYSRAPTGNNTQHQKAKSTIAIPSPSRQYGRCLKNWEVSKVAVSKTKVLNEMYCRAPRKSKKSSLHGKRNVGVVSVGK